MAEVGLNAALRKLHDGKIWPTLALAGLAWGIFAWSATAFFQGWIPASCAVLLCTLANYIVFTPLHEAAHGNLDKGRQGFLTIVFGYASGLTFLAPYRLFRAIHLTHHAYTNHPQRDPDYWVRGRNVWTVAIKCFSVYPSYMISYILIVKRSFYEKLVECFLVFFYWTLSIWLLRNHWDVFLCIIALPTWGATALQAFVFDWVPHHPHESRQPGEHTRNLPHPFLNFLMICHNWHAVHHRDPRLPFFHYEKARDLLTQWKDGRGQSLGDEPLKSEGTG